jgi:hypothetical protein
MAPARSTLWRLRCAARWLPPPRLRRRRGPSCDGQLLSCGCRYDEDGPDEEEDELAPEDAGRVSIDFGE